MFEIIGGIIIAWIIIKILVAIDLYLGRYNH